MSVAMYALINKKYNNLVYGLKVMFSCIYAFCGYVILYGSCFTPWMDIVAFFPILIMAYDRMLETGKKMLYICMIALCFIINYYLSAINVTYIHIPYLWNKNGSYAGEKAVEGNCMECRYRYDCRYRTFSIRACSCICTAFFITERWCV